MQYFDVIIILILLLLYYKGISFTGDYFKNLLFPLKTTVSFTFMPEQLDERYRKFLQNVLIKIFKQGTDGIKLNIDSIQELMNVEREEAEIYFNIFNHTTKFLEIMKKSSDKDKSKIKVDSTLNLSINELISYSDFSVLSSKVPLMEKDFVKCTDLLKIKQKYPFLFRFMDGKWRCSAIGENLSKEFKSFSKMNMIPPKMILENLVINIAKDS